MRFLVSQEASFLFVAISTLRARKGSLAGVNSEMDHEVTTALEALAAFEARIRPLVGVNSLVLDETVFVSEGLLALGT